LLIQKLKPGTLVLLRNSARDGRKGDKFQAKYLGPYISAEDWGRVFSGSATKQQAFS